MQNSSWYNEEFSELRVLRYPDLPTKLGRQAELPETIPGLTPPPVLVRPSTHGQFSFRQIMSYFFLEWGLKSYGHQHLRKKMGQR